MLKKNFVLFFKNNISFLAKISIAIAAYTFIAYKLASNHTIVEKQDLFYDWNLRSCFYLAITFVLMLSNWFIESYKWKTIVNPFEKISNSTAIKAVLFGLTSAIFTPYRLGDFIGRPMMISEKNRIQAVLATFIGSLAQTSVTICMGTVGFYLLSMEKTNFKHVLLYNSFLARAFIISSSILCLYLYLNPKFFLYIVKKIKFINAWSEKISFLSNYSYKQLLFILFLSLIRYIIFIIQYLLLLKLFHVEIDFLNAFSAISLGYLFLFSIPGIPIAEPGLRGSIALFFLGLYSQNQYGIVASSVGLWVINLAIPSFIGPLFIFNKKVES